MNIFFKKEFLQYTGRYTSQIAFRSSGKKILLSSFKERGARYALSMLSDEQKRKGVVAASLGNHSQVKFSSIHQAQFTFFSHLTGNELPFQTVEHSLYCCNA